MISVYTGEEKTKELKIKKRLMAIWYTVLGVYVLALAGFLTWFYLLDYLDPMLIWLQVIVITLTSLFLIYTYLFFSLPYKRQRMYVRLLDHLEKGLKEFGEGKFLRFCSDVEVRETVDFYQMITEEWSERRQDYLERKILIDKQKPFPKIEEGEVVMYKTQGNVLLEYEVKKLDKETEL